MSGAPGDGPDAADEPRSPSDGTAAPTVPVAAAERVRTTDVAAPRPTTPQDALVLARQRAAAAGPVELPGGGLEVSRSSRPSDEDLIRWSVVEPDLDEIRSTRRLGAPVTRAKRMLLRLLGQYHSQVLSVQNRVNVHLALRSSLAGEEAVKMRAEIELLRRRVRELEAVAGVDPGPEAHEADADAHERFGGGAA